MNTQNEVVEEFLLKILAPHKFKKVTSEESVTCSEL